MLTCAGHIFFRVDPIQVIRLGLVTDHVNLAVDIQIFSATLDNRTLASTTHIRATWLYRHRQTFLILRGIRSQSTGRVHEDRTNVIMTSFRCVAEGYTGFTQSRSFQTTYPRRERSAAKTTIRYPSLPSDSEDQAHNLLRAQSGPIYHMFIPGRLSSPQV